MPTRLPTWMSFGSKIAQLPSSQCTARGRRLGRGIETSCLGRPSRRRCLLQRRPVPPSKVVGIHAYCPAQGSCPIPRVSQISITGHSRRRCSRLWLAAGETNRVCALECSPEHAAIGSVDAQILIQKTRKIVVSLIFVHCED